MKKIIIATLAATLFSASALAEPNTLKELFRSECVTAAEIIENVTVQRQQGVSLTTALNADVKHPFVSKYYLDYVMAIYDFPLPKTDAGKLEQSNKVRELVLNSCLSEFE
jgi:hypothetical protein